MLRQLAAIGLGGAGLHRGSERLAAQEATAETGAASAADTRLNALDADTRDSVARAIWLTKVNAGDLSETQLAKLLSPENSNHAFGERMRARLLELVADEPSFVPSYAAQYEAFLALCDSLSAHQAYAMTSLMGPPKSRGYTEIPSEANLVFPDANIMQLDAQLGWYFFVGSCVDAAGQEYGIELMFFGGGLLPPDLAAQFGLNDLQNQVFEMHFAVAKAGDRHFQAKPIVLAGTSGLLAFDRTGLGAAMGRNTIQSLSMDSVFPLRIQAWGQDDGANPPAQFSIDLTFSSGRDYLLQGADGCMPCCDGVGTLYYSIPGLMVDPEASTLTFDGQQVSLASGTFWFDHQWGMLSGVPNSRILRAAGNLQQAGPGGWDWFEAQFVSNRQLTLHSLHSNPFREFYFQTGATPPGVMDVPIGGKYMDEAGVTHDIAGTMAVTEWVLSQKSPAPLDYPPTDTWYPNRWEFQFGDDLPEEIRAFVMVPIVSGGQSGFFASGAQYSEGAVHLLDPDGNDIGRGFAESVAYADTLAVQMRMAGLEPSPENQSLFRDFGPDDALKAMSEGYVAFHLQELKDTTAACIGF